MELYDYIYKESKRGEKSLILIIDLNEFNNVSIHIDDDEEVDHGLWVVKFGDEIQLAEYLENIYNNETDPHSRGEN